VRAAEPQAVRRPKYRAGASLWWKVNTSGYIWFFVADVRALSRDEQPLVEDSAALLQCIVQAPSFEAALPKLDAFLESQAFRRVDIFIAQRHDPDEAVEEMENQEIAGGIAEVLASGRPWRGIMFLAREASSWKNPPESEAPRG
jgi:hypothetical protein